MYGSGNARGVQMREKVCLSMSQACQLQVEGGDVVPNSEQRCDDLCVDDLNMVLVKKVDSGL